MKMSMLGAAKVTDADLITVPLAIGKPPKVRVVDVPVAPQDLPGGGWEAIVNSPEPQRIAGLSTSQVAFYIFRGRVVQVTGIGHLSANEVRLEVANLVLRHEKRCEQLRRQLDAFKNLDRADSERRERIPEDVRLFVWQRDQGKCAKCGSSERLEFGHGIPVAKGGSNTNRNIQLLCELCNREEGSNL